MTFIAVLDFSTSNVFILSYRSEDTSNEAIEGFLESKHFKMSEVSFMTVNDDLNIHMGTETFSVREMFADRKTVQSIDQLRERAKNRQIDIYLSKGGIKSSKSVTFRDGMWTVCSDIDGSENDYSEASFKRTLLAKMIKEKAVFYY